VEHRDVSRCLKHDSPYIGKLKHIGFTQLGDQVILCHTGGGQCVVEDFPVTHQQHRRILHDCFETFR
jgi:hypothetical protein